VKQFDMIESRRARVGAAVIVLEGLAELIKNCKTSIESGQK